MLMLWMRKYFWAGLLGVMLLPMVVSAQPDPISADYINPLTEATVDGVLTSFLNSMQAIVVTLAIVFIVIGAILYIFSSGDEGRIKMAKGAVTAAVVGLALAIAAPAFLKEIYNILAVTDQESIDALNSVGGTTALTLAEIVMNVLNFLLSIAGTLAIVMLIVGGLMYLTSAGNEKQVDTGKSIFKSAVIGIAIVMAAMIIVSQVAVFFAN